MRTKILDRRLALSAFLLAGLPATALAAPPQILDRVPANADVVIAVKQVNDFLADLDQINRLLGDDPNPQIVFATSMVRGMPGINLDGDAAFVITLPREMHEDTEPTIVALLPVSDFNALAQGREPQDGLVLLPLPDAQVYARDLGNGHAAISDNADAVRAFDAAAGRLAQHTARIGPAGGRVVSGSEVSIIANAESLRPMLLQGLEGAKEAGQMVVMMAGEEAAMGFNTFLTVANSVVRDLSAGVLGLTITEDGMTYDMAVQFTRNSESGTFFTRTGSTGGLLDRLPTQRFIVAAALDTSSPTIAKVAEAIEQWTATLPEEMRERSGFAQMSLADLNKLTNGAAFVMGTPPGLMGGGIFTNTTQYLRAADPEAYRNAMLKALEEADGQAQEGITVATNVNADAVTIDGTSLTSYTMTMKMDPQAMGGMGAMPGMDPTMIMQMVFGPAGGPSGYIGLVEGGVVQTMSQAPDMTRRALAAAKNAQGLGQNERVKRAASRLQDNRIAELYISVDEILNTVGPTLMMFGLLPEFQPAGALDPIGLSLSTDAGGFSGRIYMPNATLKAITDMMPDAPPGMGQPGGNQGFDF
ncbi:MAG: hypothetical protein LAT64_11745 [Phycisphaerales bacterium]|nr:hypothetical protein [Planctomycetota bacterium]MCH8509424.1 hypothetical protein [Phycisphaerales bacterium]